MWINKKTDYGIQTLMVLAKQGDNPISVREIHQITGIPYRYLGQVVRALRIKKLIISSRGRGGGYILGDDSKNITLLKIVESLQGKITFSECISKKGHEISCFLGPGCQVRREWVQIEGDLKSKLTKINLSNLRY